MHYTHIFGPVNSRRLGRSLGVDLVPSKACCFNCVYCECGATTIDLDERKEFFPVGEVIRELDDYLSESPEIDFITFSGSGEPTLSLSIGIVIRHLKERFPGYRIAVLTNGSLLCNEEVRQELLPADVILPTLSSSNEETFIRIHRPSGEITARRIIAGIRQFRTEYPGQIWLEVFIIPGLNTSPGELAGLKEVIEQIRPDRVQINTLDRPGPEAWVKPATLDELEKIKREIAAGSAGSLPVVEIVRRRKNPFRMQV